MNYSDYKARMGALIVIRDGEDPDYTTIFPAMVEYAENRLYRDMQMVCRQATDDTLTFTANDRKLTLKNTLIEATDLYFVKAGIRKQIKQVALAFLDTVAPDPAATGDMVYWSVLDAYNVVVAPTPITNYPALVTGKYRLDPLSETNTETYISINYPELMIIASMVFLSGYQRDYGAMSDDPQKAISWEAQYQTLLKSAMQEEARRQASRQA